MKGGKRGEASSWAKEKYGGNYDICLLPANQNGAVLVNYNSSVIIRMMPQWLPICLCTYTSNQQNICIWFVHGAIFFYVTLRCTSDHRTAACQHKQLSLRLNCKVVDAKICKWVISRKEPPYAYSIYTVNQCFLLLWKPGRQQEERRGDNEDSYEETALQVVACDLTVPFIFGAACSLIFFCFCF